MERWRRWTAPVEIVDDPASVIVEGDEMSRAHNVKWPQEMVDRIRLGYVCLKCFEPNPEPFPVKCGNPVCEYPMRARQAQDFELEFVGTEQYVSDAERDWQEIERLDERAERRLWKPGQQISVPKRIVIPGRS